MRCTIADSGKTQSSRTTITVPARASACSGQTVSEPVSLRTSAGSCRPMSPNTTLSSRKITVPLTALNCSRRLALVIRCAWVPSRMLATTTAVTPEACTASAAT